MAYQSDVSRSRNLLIVLIILFLIVVLIFISRSCRFGEEAQPPTTLSNTAGVETLEFQLLDTVLLNARDLEPRSGYEILVIRDDGEQVGEVRLSTDARGRIADAPVWHEIGRLPCAALPGEPIDATQETPVIPEPVDVTFSDYSYRLVIRRDDRIERELDFKVASLGLQPTVYATDARGCPKTGFLIGEEDIWVRGKNLPARSIVRLWAAPAQGDWADGDPLDDRTKRYDGEVPPVFELRAGATSFHRLLWPRGQTSIGSYDIVAELVHYPVGNYVARRQAQVDQVVASIPTSGFVVQRRPGIDPLEMDVAGSVQSPFSFRSAFLTDEDVYVGVDPAVQPSFVGQTADVYIVNHRTEAQWVADKSLPDPDVTGYVEKLTVSGICGNCWKTLAWSHPLAVGDYDVVLDFNQNGQYDSGVDLIDALDPVGFFVAEVRVESVSFNYSGSGAITVYDEDAGSNVAAPEFVSAGNLVMPAAWVQGGTHAVQIAFRAVSSVNSAQVWASGGLGGLANSASPASVNFSGGTGQATINVGSTPASVAKTVFSWNWQYKNVNGASTAAEDMGTTGEHVLYTVVATPTAPQQQPWIGTLEIATTAASGTTTAAAATRAIWDDFYNNAGGLYDTGGGSPQYTGSTTASFNLTSWLSNYNSGGIGIVNCYDMGKSVLVFANALGANAVYTYVSPFGHLNAVKPIGRGWTNNPFDPLNPMVDGDSARTGFGNHGFTRLGGQIYDGSGGQVDVDNDPDFGPPHTARELDGDDSWNADYRNRVIDFTPPSSPGTPADYAFTVY